MRWSDRDLLGHVNNVTYLTYVEEARIHLHDLLRASSPEPTSYLVAHARCDYLTSVTDYPGEIDVDLWVSAIGMSSMTVDYELRQGAVVVARARNVMVATNSLTGRPRPLTLREHEVLEQHLVAAG
jgi:acyl-CoA thioester hydrolase